MPKQAGYAVNTCDGYLDPRTGAPFEVDGNPDRFLFELGKSIRDSKGIDLPDADVLNFGGLSPIIYSRLQKGFDAKDIVSAVKKVLNNRADL